MSRDLLDLVRELNTLNDDNLADRVIKNSDVQWCLSELQDILEGMPTLTPPNEWVSVDERLPEKCGEYIVCACDEGEPIDERIWGDTVVVCADYYDGTFTWYECNTEYDISDIVTYWMPLPAPPGKDNNVPAKAQNEPLTLDELREMDGAPVWVDDKKTWALLQVWDDKNIDVVFPMPRGCFHVESVIGRKIYRRPPEGEA